MAHASFEPGTSRSRVLRSAVAAHWLREHCIHIIWQSDVILVRHTHAILCCLIDASIFVTLRKRVLQLFGQLDGEGEGEWASARDKRDRRLEEAQYTERVCVCVREREKERIEKERERECVCERERESVWESASERKRVCVCERGGRWTDIWKGRQRKRWNQKPKRTNEMENGYTSCDGGREDREWRAETEIVMKAASKENLSTYSLSLTQPHTTTYYILAWVGISAQSPGLVIIVSMNSWDIHWPRWFIVQIHCSRIRSDWSDSYSNDIYYDRSPISISQTVLPPQLHCGYIKVSFLWLHSFNEIYVHI